MGTKVRVAINGFGTIGKRVADAVSLQDDMEVVGVVKTRPTFDARLAEKRNYRLFVNSKEAIPAFERAGIRVHGTIHDLLDDADIVVDCTPKKVGAQNKEALYAPRRIKAIFEGGEKADVAEASFNAFCNYAECLNKKYVRVVSCNTTGLCRTLGALDREIGIKKVRATMIRRAADPGDSGRGPINAIAPNPPEVPSHHGIDVNTILPKLDILTTAFVVPTTLMHVHAINLVLNSPARREDIMSIFEKTPRVIIVDAQEGVASTAQIMEYARELGRPRSDMYEIAVWRESVNIVNGNELFYIQAVHQESDVIPENIDAIRAVTGIETDAKKSMKKTDESLGIFGGEYV